jgi:integrase
MHIAPVASTASQALGRPEQAGTLTAAAAIPRIRARADLTLPCRRDLIHAARKAAMWSGLPLDALRLDPVFLRERKVLDLPLAPPTTKESAKRAIRSRFKRLMEELGLLDRDGTPIAAIWQACLMLMDAHERRGLAAFARFCSARRIAPEAVTLETLRDFLAHLIERSLHRAPRKRVGELRTSWNAACRLEGWPGQVLPELTDADQFILPPGAFPQPFQEALDRLVSEMTAAMPDDPFPDIADDDDAGDDDAPHLDRKPVRLVSAESRRDHARWAASALVATGVPIEQITALACLVTPLTRVRDILRFVHQRKGGKPSPLGNHIGGVLHIIARYQARLPRKALQTIRAWRKPVTHVYKRMTDKNRACVRAVLAPDRERRLAELPGVLMDAARKLLATSPKEAVSLAFQAAVIQLLSRNPLRQGNLRALEFQRHLKYADAGGLISHIDIEADETKNTRAILAPVGPDTARMLRIWIDDFRPLIADPTCLYLFPGHGTGNRPITPQSLRDAVKAATRRVLGVAITPHQFRHLAAKAYLREFPGEYETVRQFLGHASLVTTIRSYCDDADEAAMRRFEQTMLARVARLGKQAREQRGPRAGGR